MTKKRRIAVRILAAIAFIALFLLPVIGFMATETDAGQTAESARAYSGDYVFFVVQNDDVPLAAVPMTDTSSYIMWVGLAFLAITIMSVYSAWYLSIRRNVWELSNKLSPLERRAIKVSTGFFHPVRSYHIAKEAEDSVASMYVNYI